MRRCTIIDQDETDNEAPITKIMIDESTDFRFHAAYEAYSKIWALGPPNKVKKELNEIITSLSTEKLSYKDFYYKIGEFRRELTPNYKIRRGRIPTQRKRDWRRKEARKKRNSRYRKRRSTLT